MTGVDPGHACQRRRGEILMLFVGALLVWSLATVSSSALATPIVGHRASHRSSLTVSGGATRTVAMCPSASRRATIVPLGHAARIVLRGTTRPRLVIEVCESGHFVPDRTIGGHRASLTVPQDGSDDYWVRAYSARRLIATRYVRIGAGEIVDAPVTFSVINQNRTPQHAPASARPFLNCVPAPDDQRYTLHGTLIAPRAVLDEPSPSVALYLHGLGLDSDFWHFTAVPGYDYATQQADAGHASVLLDLLGYGASAVSNGNTVSLCSQADVTNQAIGDLKRGDYTSSATTTFSRVALVGYSFGGNIAEITQYSFGSADALADVAWADQYESIPITLDGGESIAECLDDPQREYGSTGAEGFQFTPPTSAEFSSVFFYDVDPAVEQAALALRRPDPCGEEYSAIYVAGGADVGDDTITVPVLVIGGLDDATYNPEINAAPSLVGNGPTYVVQAENFTGTKDLTLDQLPNTGSAVTLGRTHEAFRQDMATWLTRHGF